MQGQTDSYVLTTLLTAPASAALTTLTNVKDELSIKPADVANDSQLTRFIREESAGIARYCNRIFGLATWQDQFRLSRGVWGEGVREANNPLMLSRYPLVGPPVLFTGTTNGTKVVGSVSSTDGLANGQPIFAADIPAGTTIASFTPVSVLLSAAALESTPSEQLTAGMSVVQTDRGNEYNLVYGTDYEVSSGSMLPGDEGSARVYRLNECGNPRTWFGQLITIIYQAGYSLPGQDCGAAARSLPGDLESACIELVVMRFRKKGRDPTVMERAQPGLVGTERYWVGGAPGQKGPYTPDIAGILDNYRVPVIA